MPLVLAVEVCDAERNTTSNNKTAVACLDPQLTCPQSPLDRYGPAERDDRRPGGGIALVGMP